MSSNKTVTVIVTTKNSSRTIRQCLESINTQNYTNIETLVIDGISSDDTCEIASKCGAKIFSLDSERTKAKNFGTSKSNGEFLLFIDSDMILDKNVVEECGDILWYMARMLNTVGFTIEDAMSYNNQKLSTRYSTGYSDKQAIERADKSEF